LSTTVPFRRRLLAASISAAASIALAGCALPGGSPGGYPADLDRIIANPPGFDFLLLGEVHDNPEHHRRRLDWLRRLAASGRFALALEQLDADRQPEVDEAVRRGLDARALAESAGFDFRGWDWSFYGPFVELALEHRLPLVAANLSNARARRIARAPQVGADGPDERISRPPANWRDLDQQRLEREIADGHCGMLPARAIAPMAMAQRARDATMADAMLRARRSTGLPVVLIAGNGHVRRDIGVPRHLAGRMPGARILSVGILERSDRTAGSAGASGATAETPYDRIVETVPHSRSDPCEAFSASRQTGGARPPAER
jgi:uncharacterized iron-regulated protein